MVFVFPRAVFSTDGYFFLLAGKKCLLERKCSWKGKPSVEKQEGKPSLASPKLSFAGEGLMIGFQTSVFLLQILSWDKCLIFSGQPINHHYQKVVHFIRHLSFPKGFSFSLPGHWLSTNLNKGFNRRTTLRLDDEWPMARRKNHDYENLIHVRSKLPTFPLLGF